VTQGNRPLYKVDRCNPPVAKYAVTPTEASTNLQLPRVGRPRAIMIRPRIDLQEAEALIQAVFPIHTMQQDANMQDMFTVHGFKEHHS
jgi:hypothetical protein